MAALQHDPVGRALLAQADERAAAAELFAADPYQESAALAGAAALVGDEADPVDWLAHRIWCAKRRAAGDRRTPLEVRVDGAAWVSETAGRPTVLVAPMTLDTQDALEVLGAVMGGRQVIVFGEDVARADITNSEIDVATEGNEVHEALAALDRGAVYATYGDFAYAGRNALTVAMFGRPRAMSAGWVRLAGRADTMLLPIVMRREGDGVSVVVDEPTLLPSAVPPGQLAHFLAEILEQLVRRAPSQWLLLPTLTFEATQQAS